MDAKTLSAKIRGLPTFLDGAVDSGLKAFGAEAVDLNIAQMEKSGQDSRGIEFGDYSDLSKEIGYPEEKASMGKEDRFINLNFTGDFHSSMDFSVSKGAMNIFAKDDKTDLLIKKYGADIFGLNDANFDVMFDDIFDHIVRELRTYFV